MDIIEALKKHNIDTTYVSKTNELKFILEEKEVTFKMEQLDNLFLETLVNQIKFQAKMSS